MSIATQQMKSKRGQGARRKKRRRKVVFSPPTKASHLAPFSLKPTRTLRPPIPAHQCHCGHKKKDPPFRACHRRPGRKKNLATDAIHTDNRSIEWPFAAEHVAHIRLIDRSPPLANSSKTPLVWKMSHMEASRTAFLVD